MDYELHNLIEYAALEAAEPKVASDLYRLHADVAKLPTGSSWLMEQLQEKCERFPVPYQMRRVYEQRYTPADGKRTQTMGEL